jgi:uncharacterized damage-inducible protein DinB
MDTQTVVAKALTLNTNHCVSPALQGLSDADLLKRPSEQCNPIGWLLWHQTRAEDVILSHISGTPQAWITGTWHEQFHLPADPQDFGAGHSLAQVMALQPTMAALHGYAAAVREKTLAVLHPLTPADLERELPALLVGGHTAVGDLLGILLIDQFHHSGQIAYLRGYLTGKGWFPL